MSALTTLFCDGVLRPGKFCIEEFQSGEDDEWAARREAKTKGWVYHAEPPEDLCPQCCSRADDKESQAAEEREDIRSANLTL